MLQEVLFLESCLYFNINYLSIKIKLSEKYGLTNWQLIKSNLKSFKLFLEHLRMQFIKWKSKIRLIATFLNVIFLLPRIYQQNMKLSKKKGGVLKSKHLYLRLVFRSYFRTLSDGCRKVLSWDYFRL